MRISQISLEDNGVVAFNIQRRNRNFTKMLSFIFVRLREKIQIFTDLTNILVMLSVRSLLWFVLSMTKQTSSLFPLLCLSGATSSSLFLLLFHLPQIPWFMLSQTRTTEGINNLHNTYFEGIMPFSPTFSNHQKPSKQVWHDICRAYVDTVNCCHSWSLTLTASSSSYHSSSHNQDPFEEQKFWTWTAALACKVIVISFHIFIKFLKYIVVSDLLRAVLCRDHRLVNGI